MWRCQCDVTGGTTGERYMLVMGRYGYTVMYLYPCASTAVSVKWDQGTSQATSVQSQALNSYSRGTGDSAEVLGTRKSIWSREHYKQEARPDSCFQRSFWPLNGEGPIKGLKSKLLLLFLQYAPFQQD